MINNYVGTVSPCNTTEPNVHYNFGGVFQSSWGRAVQDADQ